MKEIVKFIKAIKTKINYLIDKDDIFSFVFVMGNSSCDMDSVMSAIFWAFMKNVEKEVISFNKEGTLIFNIKKDNEIFIPVINCISDQLFWRLDISELLNKIGLTEKDFFYFDDVFDSTAQKISFKILKSKRV